MGRHQHTIALQHSLHHSSKNFQLDNKIKLSLIIKIHFAFKPCLPAGVEMESELFMVKLGFDFEVKLNDFATVSQTVLECNFMLMSSQIVVVFIKHVCKLPFWQKINLNKTGCILFGGTPFEHVSKTLNVHCFFYDFVKMT